MKVKSDHRSKFSNLSNWKEEAWKISGLQWDSNPWPSRYRCDARPTELWSRTLGARSICWVHCERGQFVGLSIAPVSWRSQVWIPLKPWYFSGFSSNCWNWKIYCDDHSSLSSLICEQFLNQRLVKLCAKTAICLLTLIGGYTINYLWYKYLCCFNNKGLCYIFLCFLFFSSYQACSFWNSDTLDAVVESAVLNDTIEYWISLSELPQNVNIHGANTAVKFVFLSERGTLVCGWPSSKLAFERFILQ